MWNRYGQPVSLALALLRWGGGRIGACAAGGIHRTRTLPAGIYLAQVPTRPTPSKRWLLSVRCVGESLTRLMVYSIFRIGPLR